MKGLFTKALFLLLALGSQAASCQPQTKRVVQYYGKQVDDHGTKFHIDLLVNNPDNKTYATNVLMGEFGIHRNKSLGLNGGDPDAKANDWFWEEIKTVQDAGIKVSLWLRQGFEFLKKDNKDFDTYYAALNKTITDHNFEGIDLDIEDGQNGCPDSAMTLEDTIHLVQRLRDDFGPKFIITLAPVSDALLDEGNVSCFNYQDLEKSAAAADISWYNAQFYGGSWQGLKTPAYYERCVEEGGWDPRRVVAAITTSSDFTYPLPRSSWIGLDQTGPTIETLAKKHPRFGGIGGFEFYDAEPGGYEAPWQWSRWAARRMDV